MGAVKVHSYTITDQFGHLSVPGIGQALVIVVWVTDATSLDRTESGPQRTRIGLPVVVRNAQHKTPEAIGVVVYRIRKSADFVALVLFTVTAAAGPNPVLADE